MTLQDAMMTICHPTNEQFALLHLIDKLCWEQCHVLTVLKLAESFEHAMISALLPFLQWKFSKQDSDYVKQAITKWFKPVA